MHAFRQTTSLDHNFQNPEMEEEHKTNPFMSKSDLAVTYSSLDSYLYFVTFLVICSHNKKFHVSHSIWHCFITRWFFFVKISSISKRSFIWVHEANRKYFIDSAVSYLLWPILLYVFYFWKWKVLTQNTFTQHCLLSVK